jgi:hypothetical protein
LTRKAYFSALSVGAWLCAASGLALAQNPHQLNIDDTGKVVSSDQQHHAKKGDKISWVRQSGAKKTWYVKFTADSPCAEGKQFRNGRGCTVKAVCNKAGDTARQAQLNDPEIVIDP